MKISLVNLLHLNCFSYGKLCLRNMYKIYGRQGLPKVTVIALNVYAGYVIFV